MKRMSYIGHDPYITEGISKRLRRSLRERLDYPMGNALFRRVAHVVQSEIEWVLNPCPYHGRGTICQVCEPMSQKTISSLNYQMKRFGKQRHGCIPLRKRRKRLHKKLAKRGFSASPTFSIWSSPTPGYGTKDTKFDWL